MAGDQWVSAISVDGVILTAGSAFAAETFEIVVVESNGQPATDDGDRRRRRAVLADRSLHSVCRFDILWIGHAVTDDRRFQRHNRSIPGQRRSDVV